MQLNIPPGVKLDLPHVTAEPFWTAGYNCRYRLGQMETLGLFGPLRLVGGGQVTLPGPNIYRKVFNTPSTSVGQILAGSTSAVRVIEYDNNSNAGTGTRWLPHDVTPAGLTPELDVVPQPSTGRIGIPPVWWFSDQDDVVVGSRANVQGEPAYSWDRANRFTPLANSPTGAVGGGIVNRILVLLGSTSFTDPDPLRFMTIRWSNRYDFEDWAPSDINVSGELQLEGGSRIIGGGVTGFGVVAWTDKRMAVLNETFDPDSVFERRYIDGGRGLLANNAWCEADGQVWWFDENRVLNVFDGGRPRQIQNPLKAATVERATQAQIARGYMVANPEYGEIIFHYPDEAQDDPDTQVVYNYLHEAWSIWRLPRTAWHPRVGVVENVAIDPGGAVWRHDLDAGIPDLYLQGPPLQPGVNVPSLPPSITVDQADVEPYSFVAHTNVIGSPDIANTSLHSTRLHVNHMPMPAVGAELDEFTVQLTAYGLEQIANSPIYQDARSYVQGEMAKDYRVGGKAIQLSFYGTDIKTVFRFGAIDVVEAVDGER